MTYFFSTVTMAHHNDLLFQYGTVEHRNATFDNGMSRNMELYLQISVLWSNEKSRLQLWFRSNKKYDYSLTL